MKLVSFVYTKLQKKSIFCCPIRCAVTFDGLMMFQHNNNPLLLAVARTSKVGRFSTTSSALLTAPMIGPWPTGRSHLAERNFIKTRRFLWFEIGVILYHVLCFGPIQRALEVRVHHFSAQQSTGGGLRTSGLKGEAKAGRNHSVTLLMTGFVEQSVI